MTYSTLMAHLDLGGCNEALLRITAEFAERFDAGVIGIAACQPMPITFGDGGSYMSGEVIEQDRVEIAKETEAAEARFRAVLHGRVAKLAWRSAVSFTLLADYIADQARAADLLITGADQRGSAPARRINGGDLVLRIGRPMLIVPPGAGRLNLESVVVGWKDTRETRRAVADALPLLQQAGRVTVVEIAAVAEITAARDRLQDVVAWLKRHNIAAEPLAAHSVGDDATQLDAIAQEFGAGVLVAGAFGHNRLREWVLGGVTRTLLMHPARCSFVSH